MSHKNRLVAQRRVVLQYAYRGRIQKSEGFQIVTSKTALSPKAPINKDGLRFLPKLIKKRSSFRFSNKNFVGWENVPNFAENISKMNVDKIREIINRQPNLSTALGMEFISTPDEDMCMATMKVDERNRQPFGFLSGGASLALAENLAGVGSSALCEGKICVGISVSGSHVKAVAEGDTVTAVGHLVQKGRSLHVWTVDITDSKGDLISTVHVTNYIISPKK